MEDLLLRRRNLLEKQEEEMNIRAVCFKADGDQTVAITKIGSPPTITMQYSYDGRTWKSWDLSALPFGGSTKVYVRGVNNAQFGSSTSKYNKFTFSTDAYVYVSGIAESLLDGENEVLSIDNSYALCALFYGQTALRDAGGLKFEGLIISRTTNYAFYRMFYECTNLLTGPELLATSLSTFCYYQMFYNCSSLESLRCHAKSSSKQATYQWLGGVNATGTFYGHAEYTWASSVNGIPSGWTFIELND